MKEYKEFDAYELSMMSKQKRRNLTKYYHG